MVPAGTGEASNVTPRPDSIDQGSSVLDGKLPGFETIWRPAKLAASGKPARLIWTILEREGGWMLPSGCTCHP